MCKKKNTLKINTIIIWDLVRKDEEEDGGASSFLPSSRPGVLISEINVVFAPRWEPIPIWQRPNNRGRRVVEEEEEKNNPTPPELLSP